MINLIPIGRPLDLRKPLLQMSFNKRNFLNRSLPQRKTIHSPLNLPVRINPRRMIITMLPVINRKSMPQNIFLELLEIMPNFAEIPGGGRFLGCGERFAVDNRVFEERMPVCWRAGFLETLIEEFGNRLVEEWTCAGLPAENCRQVVQVSDTNHSRRSLQLSQPFIHSFEFGQSA